MNYLRKLGDAILYNNTTLAKDEIISPTFECTIMLWCLEKIDMRLPAKVQKDFGFRMEGNVSLYDLQTAIFQAVPGMLEELDGTADFGAAHAVTDTELVEDASLAASRFFRGGRV